MSPLTSYRRLFALAGPLYVLVAFLGRLPLAMSQLGTLLLVSGATGSYGAGGRVGRGPGRRQRGRRSGGRQPGRPGRPAPRGPRPVAGRRGRVVALVSLSTAGTPWPVQAGAAAVTGLVLPQVGPLARVRWRPITQDAGRDQRRLVDAAFSYEGAADEASFVLGPALVGGLAAVVAPGAALVVAAVVLAVFGSLFAVHESAELTRRLHGAQQLVAGRLLTPTLTVLAVAQLAIGVVFGSVQTATRCWPPRPACPG